MERLQQLIAALWFGSAIFLMLSASAAFRAAGNATVAADVVGSMLTRWHYIALAAPLVLFILQLRGSRPWLLVLLFVCVLLAAAQSFVDLRIRSIRNSTSVSMSDLDRSDPVRRRFGMLHGMSMMLLLLQAIGAGAVVMSRPGQRTTRIEPMIISEAAARGDIVETPAPPSVATPVVDSPAVVSSEPYDAEKTAGGGP